MKAARWLPLVTVLALLLGACRAAPAPPPPEYNTGLDPAAWATVPAGEFLMGPHNHVTLLDYDYQVMVGDVSNAQYAAYLNEALAAGAIAVRDGQVVGYYPGDPFHAHEHEVEITAGDKLHLLLDEPGVRLAYDGARFSAQPAYANHPAVMVTWFGAQAFCQFYGWRLPSEVEWEKAARGSDGRPFPWGGEIDHGNANYYGSGDPLEGPLGGLGDTTPLGFYNGQEYGGFATLDSPSPYGLYDMAGNVWQWTGDVRTGSHYRQLRGGSKADYEYNLRAWTRNSAGPDYFSPSVGFRCARD